MWIFHQSPPSKQCSYHLMTLCQWLKYAKFFTFHNLPITGMHALLFWYCQKNYHPISFAHALTVNIAERIMSNKRPHTPKKISPLGCVGIVIFSLTDPTRGPTFQHQSLLAPFCPHFNIKYMFPSPSILPSDSRCLGIFWGIFLLHSTQMTTTIPWISQWFTKPLSIHFIAFQIHWEMSIT